MSHSIESLSLTMFQPGINYSDTDQELQKLSKNYLPDQGHKKYTFYERPPNQLRLEKKVLKLIDKLATTFRQSNLCPELDLDKKYIRRIEKYFLEADDPSKGLIKLILHWSQNENCSPKAIFNALKKESKEKIHSRVRNEVSLKGQLLINQAISKGLNGWCDEDDKIFTLFCSEFSQEATEKIKYSCKGDPKLFAKFFKRINRNPVKEKFFDTFSGDLEAVIKLSLQTHKKMSKEEVNYLLIYLKNKELQAEIGPFIKNNIERIAQLVEEKPDEMKGLLAKLPVSIKNLIAEKTQLKCTVQTILKDILDPNCNSEISKQQAEQLNKYFAQHIIENEIQTLANSTASNIEGVVKILQVLRISEINPKFHQFLIDKLENSKVLTLIEPMLKIEVENSKEEILLRGDSLTARLISYFQKKMLTPVLRKKLDNFNQCISKEPYILRERDCRSENKEAEIIKAQERLLVDFEDFLVCLLKFVKKKDFPREIKLLTQSWTTIVSNQFRPEKGYLMSPQLFILRGINPYFSTDEEDLMNQKLKCCYRVLCKCLQNLANNSQNRKEDEYKFFIKALKDNSKFENIFREIIENLLEEKIAKL